MAGKIIADTLEHSTAGSVTTNYVVEGSVKSWINQQNDATQNNTNDSFNASSTTDHGAGDNTFTVVSAFSSAAFVCNTGYGNNTVTDRCGVTKTSGDGTQQSSTTYRSFAYDMSTNASGNLDGLQVICIGDLA